MGNGLANIIAAVIVAAAILFNGVLDGRRKPVTAVGAPAGSEEEFRDWYARAVGDIRNDIVVNCGCCGEGEKKPGF
ncbi:MAG: hypothetical protein ABL957_07850 [Parvularculaceae bacterium]